MTYVKYFLIVLTLLIQTVSAQSVDNPKITYFHNDITGTPIAASDEEGNIIWREERRSYGEIKVDPLKPKTLEEFSVGFTGHQADRESGLTYAKARYYNPSIGRFYAPDPIPFRQNDLVSFNRYAYAGNNPYKYVDPTGKEPMRGDSDWDTVNRWGSINSAFNQVGYGLDTYKGEIAVVATGVGTVSMMGTAAIVAGAKEAVSEIASEITGGLSDFLSVKGLFNKALKSPTEIAKIMESSKYSPTQSLAKMDIEKINTYSKVMKQGKWDWSGGKIVVDKNNSIMDGHHRAIAAEKAGVAVPESAKINFNGITERPSYDSTFPPQIYE